jgi:integrase
METVVRAKRPQRVPTVLSRDEVNRLLAMMDGHFGLMASLLYGSGMRLMECVRLRVKDVDFELNQICVRDGKGGKDRHVPLPRRLREALHAQLERVCLIHQQDLASGLGAVWLPHALARKYPSAPREPGWQYVFPSDQLSRDPRDGVRRRHHVDEGGLQRAVRNARLKAGIASRPPAIPCGTPLPPTCWKPGTIFGLSRNCSATRMWQRRPLLRIHAPAALAHPCAAQIYTHVLNRGGHGVLSPLDR